MLRAHFLAFFFFMSSQALAVEITCEDLLGTESATLVNGDFSIEKNDRQAALDVLSEPTGFFLSLLYDSSWTLPM